MTAQFPVVIGLRRSRWHVGILAGLIVLGVLAAFQIPWPLLDRGMYALAVLFVGLWALRNVLLWPWQSLSVTPEGRIVLQRLNGEFLSGTLRQVLCALPVLTVLELTDVRGRLHRLVLPLDSLDAASGRRLRVMLSQCDVSMTASEDV